MSTNFREPADLARSVGGGVEGKPHIDGIGPEHAPKGSPGLPKECDHGVIFALHLGNELVESPFPGDVGQRVEERLGHAEAALRFPDDESHLSPLAVFHEKIAADGVDDLGAVWSRRADPQSEIFALIHAHQLSRARRCHLAEEVAVAKSHGLLVMGLEKCDQPVRVRERQRAQLMRRASEEDAPLLRHLRAEGAPGPRSPGETCIGSPWIHGHRSGGSWSAG